MNGEVNAVPLEVALTLKATGGPESTGSSAIISLLDWYDLDQELILVLERPVPCVDLSQYVKENGGSLQEHEAKVNLMRISAVWFQWKVLGGLSAVHSLTCIPVWLLSF